MQICAILVFASSTYRSQGRTRTHHVFSRNPGTPCTRLQVSLGAESTDMLLFKPDVISLCGAIDAPVVTYWCRCKLLWGVPCADQSSKEIEGLSETWADQGTYDIKRYEALSVLFDVLRAAYPQKPEQTHITLL